MVYIILHDIICICNMIYIYKYVDIVFNFHTNIPIPDQIGIEPPNYNQPHVCFLLGVGGCNQQPINGFVKNKPARSMGSPVSQGLKRSVAHKSKRAP